MPSFNYEILNEQYSYYNGHTSYGIKIIGYSHLRKNIPCQDSFKIWTSNKTNSVIYSIADGHGDPRYDFSQDGSRIAVNTAVNTLKANLEKDFTNESFFNYVQKKFPTEILTNWQEEVIKDLINKNITNIEPLTFKRYGTTLITVISTSIGLYLCQLGDGNIVLVDNEFNIDEPIPENPYTIGNSTYSIVSKNSPNLWTIKPYQITKPTLLIISTDGLANCFEPDDFKKFCISLYKNILSFGFKAVTLLLPDWLENASKNGSGDDISLILSLLGTS